MAFIALADRDQAAADRAAMQMAREAWERRAEIDTTAPTVAEAVAHAYAAPAGPVVLLDVGDNIGGGSTGDSTFILEELLHRGQGDYLITVNDAASARDAVGAGVGHEVEVNLGGKVDKQHGTPQRVRARVRTISDGHFTARGTVHGGWTAFDAGVTAVLETPDHGFIVVTSGPLPTMALDQHYSIGLRPESFKVVIAKGVQSPKPAYGPIAKEMLYVDTPGIATANMRRLNHQHRRRPMFPFEPETTF
jgi:microcystin degradation protein MlrC